MPARQAITALDAPPALGPYSHAVSVGGLLFCSGQIPIDPTSGELAPGGTAQRAARCLENLAAVCSAAGASLGAAVSVTVYLTDLDAVAEVDEAYGRFFAGADPPARVTVGVAALPRGAEVEIAAVVAMAH